MTTSDRSYLIADDHRRSDPEEPSSIYEPYYPEPIIQYTNSTLKPYIDGQAYFRDLNKELDQLTSNRRNGSSSGSDQRIYLANWSFDAAFECIPKRKLADALRDHAADGVDVRVLLWVNEDALLYDDTIGDPKYTGRSNLSICEELRSYPNLENKVLLNVLDHLYGSSHCKIALLADKNNRSYAYTGGIDFAIKNASAKPRHLAPQDSKNGDWHDVQARIEGDSTAAVFEYFKALWDALVAQRQREEDEVIPGYGSDPWVPAGFSRTTRVWLQGPLSKVCYAVPQFATRFAVEDVLVPSIPTEPETTVQSLRTVPDLSQGWWATPNLSFPALPKRNLSIAPSGIYETYLAFKCAIAAAQDYIYIENYVTHSRALLRLLKDAIIAKSELKVIFLTAAGTKNFSSAIPVHNYYLYEYLYKDLGDNEDWKSRIALYKCTAYCVHAKVMIVDDRFAMIGSANFSNRSLFSDFEHGVAFVANDGFETVAKFRQELWSEHFRLSAAQREEVSGFEAGLHVWNEHWGTPGATFVRPSHLELTPIRAPRADFELSYRNEVEEVGALPEPVEVNSTLRIRDFAKG